MHDDDEFYQEVRYLQRKTRCSNVVCREFVKVFKKFSPIPVKSSISRFDSKAKEEAGCDYIILHGCPNCNRHVYKPTDQERTCPVCAHPRFNNKGKPLEVFGICLFCICLCACFFVLLHTYVCIISCRCVSIFQYGRDCELS